MPYVINQNDIVSVTVRYGQLNTQIMLNTFHYRYISPTPLADGAAEILKLCEQFEANAGGAGWGGTWTGIAASVVNIDAIIGQRVYPVRYAQVLYDINLPGGIAAQPLPSVVQWSITKRGDLATRYAVGGVRIPGLPDTYEVGGELTAVAKPFADALAAIVKATITVDGTKDWQPVVYRRTNPGSSVAVVESFAQYTVRSQRSRIAFRGI